MSPGRDANAVPSLPPSVEAAYRAKCIQLRERMQEVELANDEYRKRRERLVRGIRKMRLERAILLETLGKRMRKNRPADGAGSQEDDTEDSTDSPPTPQERPMRIKRSHRRADTSFLHESTPTRPSGEGGNDTASNRGDGPGASGELGVKDEDMADADAEGESARKSVERGTGGGASSLAATANNGDAQSTAGDSEMAQD